MTTARPPWWLVALLVLLAFSFQGTRGIWEPDEGRYSAVGINMLQSGDWLVPTADGEHPHLTKPPITYWALAASFGLLGRNEWAARLPGALAFIGTGLLVFGIGRRMCPAQPWLPALVHALSLAPFMSANVVSTDVVLTFFETAAMFAFIEAWHHGAGLDRRWIRAMWLAWALAFMTKGPPGLLPLLSVVALLAWQDRSGLRRLFDPVGLLVFVVVAFSWFAIIIGRDPSRLDYFIGYEVYDRVFTGLHGRNSAWYGAFEVYLPVLLAGALPWWVFSLVAARGPRPAWSALRGRVRARDRHWLLLLAWFFLPLVVFMLARSRLHLYVLPLFVPLSIIVARPLAGWPWLTGRRLAWIAATTAVALVGIKGTLAHWPNNRDAREMARSIKAILDPLGIDEIAFVDMRPFYGLSVYLDVHTEGIRLHELKPALSRYLSEEDLCAEIAEREANVYALKESRSERFIAGVRRCTGHDPEPIGDFMADDNRIVLYAVSVVPGVPVP
jgi:4-amino-4-deoxy-L-arabinose transferase-like glycosyltransferase